MTVRGDLVKDRVTDIAQGLDIVLQVTGLPLANPLLNTFCVEDVLRVAR